MKIMHLITNLNSGGAEKMLVKILEMEKNTSNYNVVVTLFEAGFHKLHVENLGYKIIELNITKPAKFIKKLPIFLKELGRIDVVHCWMYHANIFGYFFGKLLNKKVVWNIRRSFIDKKQMKRSTYTILKLNKVFSKNVDGIIYNSKLGSKTHNAFGFKNKNTQVIANGFLAPKIKADFNKNKFLGDLGIDSELVLCNIARWEPLKDHDNLFEALFYLKKYIQFKIIMCGKNIDNNNAELVELINKYELKDYVVLLGERKYIDGIMSLSDIYISSSKSEGFPNVIGEAMYNKILVISTDAGDSRYILDDDRLIVEIGNPEELSARIIEMHSKSNKEKNEIKEKLYSRVKNDFGIEAIHIKYTNFFKGVAK